MDLASEKNYSGPRGLDHVWLAVRLHDHLDSKLLSDGIVVGCVAWLHGMMLGCGVAHRQHNAQGLCDPGGVVAAWPSVLFGMCVLWPLSLGQHLLRVMWPCASEVKSGIARPLGLSSVV